MLKRPPSREVLFHAFPASARGGTAGSLPLHLASPLGRRCSSVIPRGPRAGLYSTRRGTFRLSRCSKRYVEFNAPFVARFLARSPLGFREQRADDPMLYHQVYLYKKVEHARNIGV